MSADQKQADIQNTLPWAVLAALVCVPVTVAAFSPLLSFRSPIYIIAGFAGIFGLVILLIQPVLAMGRLPHITASQARRAHRWTGSILVVMVVVHVIGLWITSPPDVIDVLLFASPTPFSVWGVVAMWAIFGVALLVLLRRRLRVALWRRLHLSFAVVIVTGTVGHALLIQGTMEPISKAILCAAVVAATIALLLTNRRWKA